jgi:hypothetical protein
MALAPLSMAVFNACETPTQEKNPQVKDYSLKLLNQDVAIKCREDLWTEASSQISDVFVGLDDACLVDMTLKNRLEGALSYGVNIVVENGTYYANCVTNNNTISVHFDWLKDDSSDMSALANAIIDFGISKVGVLDRSFNNAKETIQMARAPRQSAVQVCNQVKLNRSAICALPFSHAYPRQGII